MYISGVWRGVYGRGAFPFIVAITLIVVIDVTRMYHSSMNCCCRNDDDDGFKDQCDEEALLVLPTKGIETYFDISFNSIMLYSLFLWAQQVFSKASPFVIGSVLISLLLYPFIDIIHHMIIAALSG